MDERLARINEWWSTLPEHFKWECFHRAMWDAARCRYWWFESFKGKPIIIGG
jgi:hypothetical protein